MYFTPIDRIRRSPSPNRLKAGVDQLQFRPAGNNSPNSSLEEGRLCGKHREIWCLPDCHFSALRDKSFANSEGVQIFRAGEDEDMLHWIRADASQRTTCHWPASSWTRVRTGT